MAKRRRQSDDHVPIRQQARRYTSLIFAGKQLDANRVTDLKNEGFWLIAWVLDNSPIRRTDLLGEPHAKTLKSLSRPLPTPFTERIEAELRWTAATVLHYSQVLREFVAAKRSFELDLLHARYEDASQALSQIESRFGKSIWGIEVAFLLEQYRGGLEANRDMLLRYQGDDIPGWIQIFAHFFSQRVEDSIPSSEYDEVCGASFGDDPDGVETQHLRSYLRFRLNFHRFTALDNLPYVLHLEESHSLIDRYLTFVRVTQRLLSEGTAAVGSELSGVLSAVAGKLNDPALSLLCTFLRPDALEVSNFSTVVQGALHSYTVGDYSTVREVCLTALQQHPDRHELYELASKSSLRSGLALENPFPSDTTPHQILLHTHRVISRARSTQESLEQLLRLSYQLDSFPIGIQLFAFVRQHSDDRSPLRNDRLASFSASAATPRLSMAYGDPQLATRFLTRLGELYPSNAAVLLFSSTWQSISAASYSAPPVAIPPARLCKYRAFILETLGDHAGALKAYRELHAQTGEDALLTADSTTGQYRCCLRLGHAFECATILADAAVRNPQLVSSTTVREVLELYKHSREQHWLKNIAWPILFCAANREGYLASSAEYLHDVLDDFLTAWGVSRPTELRSGADTFQPDSLIYMLRYLCIPEVLDSSIWYDSQDDLEHERMEICEWLSGLDESSREAYSNEIAELTKAATMRELTHTVDRSKVHVGVEEIKAALGQSFRDRVNRCIVFTQLKRKELRQSLELLGFKELFKDTDIVLIDSGFRQFASIFGELKQRFISSNEYGLDSSLSQRIRHGTLSGETRSSFEAYHLVTQKDATGEYVENRYWLNRLSIESAEVRSAVRDTFAELSKTIDGTVSEVRNTWIQIKGPANYERGMFDYDFDDVQLHWLYQPVEELADFDSFIEFAFDCLWQRTETNLASVRTAIQDQLRARFTDALDLCQRRLDELLNPEQRAEFRSAVTNCKTQLGYCLGGIAEWFHVDRGQRMPDFRVGVLVDALLHVVARCSGPCKLNVRRQIAGSGTLQGKYFRALWDLMFILLDNIVKHSRLDEASVHLNIQQQGNRLAVEVLNDLGQSVDRDVLRERVSLLQTPDDTTLDQGILRREGGTGFYKLRKIMKYDVGCRDYELTLEVKQDGRFSVRLAMTLGEDHQ